MQFKRPSPRRPVTCELIDAPRPLRQPAVHHNITVSELSIESFSPAAAATARLLRTAADAASGA